MRKFLKLFPLILNIHDAGAPGAAPAAAQAGTSQPADGQQAKSGEKTVYGKQPAQTPPDAGENPADAQKKPADRKAEFEKLIGGEYKNEFSEFFQTAFDRRFKDHKETSEKLDSLNPLIDTLKAKYNVEGDDPKKLVEAFENDSRFFEEMADEAGLSVDQYKEMLKLRRENAKYKGIADQAEADQQRIQRNIQLRQQETTMKARYPDFDLAKLVTGNSPSNRQFATLLDKGIDIEPAFQAAFFNELMTGAMSATGKRVEQNLTNNIQAKGQRPREAGAASTPGITVKDDVSKLSKADRAEIIRRAARGEKITF